MSSRRPLLLVTATAHLDTQWRWTVRDTIRDFLPRTLRENFALFRSHPGYVLSFEGAFRYMLVREYYPEAWEELRRWCREGRWAPVGAMLDAPDVNVVSPESLVRQILYGQRFFARQLGVESRDVFLPDCFGFGRALPSVAAHCGLGSFSTSKLIKWKAPDEIPFDVGRWRGPDGAEILAVLRPGGYGEGIDGNLSRSRTWLRRLEAIGRTCGVAVGMRYVGTGDRGGSPDRHSLDRLERASAADGPVEVRCAPSHAIREELTEEALARLPVHDSEILLPTHGTGCWTSQAALKRWNRRNELLAAAAERAAVAADWLGEIDYPGSRLRQGWLRFLWHQMHDDLTGTAIPAAYDITWNDQAVAANLLAGVLVDSLGAVSRRLDTTSETGLPLLVYNPTSHAREDVVEAVLERSSLPPGELVVTSPEGTTRPTQVEAAGASRVRVLFLAAVEPISFSVFELGAVPAADGGAGIHPAAPTVSTGQLENERYRVTVDRHGDVASVFDKRLGRELLSGPLGLELLRDRSHRWPAWEIRPETILDGGTRSVEGEAAVAVVESGPVRVGLEIRRRFAGSRLKQTLRLAAGGAGERLEIVNELVWGTRGRLLKARFPLDVASPEATYDLGLGTVRRDNNSPRRYEVPAQQWASITDGASDRGAAILSDGPYGWDKPSDDVLRLSLVRSPSSLRKYPHQRTQDLGRHRFTFALMGHAGERDHAEISRQAERLNQPLLAFAVPAAPGDLGRRLSLLRTDDDVAVTALKRAEDGDRYVVRLRDLAGRGRSVDLRFVAPPVAVEDCRGDERPTGGPSPATEAPGPAADGGTVSVALRPWGVRTLGVELPRPGPSGSTTSQVPLELPFDRRATSSHRDSEAVDFDGRGASLPAELFPETLRAGGVTLRLGPGDAANAVSCRGQELELPAGHGQLWLVLASTAAPTAARFEIDGTQRTLRVRHWTGHLAERARPGGWRGLRRARDGFLVTDELAWLATHRHRIATGRPAGAGSADSDGPADRGPVEDEPYVFCYLFRYVIDLPARATRLRLPRLPEVHLFAATAVEGVTRPRPLRRLYGGHS